MDILNKTNIQNKILRAPEFGDETGEGGASSTPSNVINIGGVEVDKFYLGNSDDVKIYLGDVKLYPRDISYKLIAQYNDTTEYKVECDGNAVLTAAEVSAHTTPKSAMTSAIVSSCDGQGSFKVGDETFSGATSLSSVTLNEGITEIGVRAFMYTSNLRSITFPSTLTKLDGVNFRYSGIRSISGIPSGVTYLGSGAFADMFSLSAATIPSSVTGSSTNVFLRDSGLTEVHFERTTAPALGADAFKNCTALIKIYIPDCDCYDSYAAQSQFSGLTNLIYGEDGTKCKPETMPYAMYRVSRNGSGVTVACNSSSSNTVTTANTRTGITVGSLTSSTATQTPVEIKFGDCCKVISTGACSGWTYLTSVTISDSVTGLSGNHQFYNCRRVKKFKVGNGLKSIGATHFAYNLGRVFSAQSASNWADVDLSRTINLTIGGDGAFQYACINNLKFGSGVRINGDGCFQHAHINSIKFNGSGSISGSASGTDGRFYMAAIGSIDFGSITSIGDYAFARTSGLASVSIPSSVTSMGNYIFSGASDITEVTLDYNGNNVGNGIFNDVGSLRKVIFGSHPTKISDNMFDNCTSLSAVTIPNNITSIGTQAFHTCSGMTSCELPNSITKIKTGTFNSCKSLTAITIPANVTEIDAYAFSGCSGLNNITVLATTPPSIPGVSTFTGNNCPIYVPADSVSAYQSAWSIYSSRIQAIPNS